MDLSKDDPKKKEQTRINTKEAYIFLGPSCLDAEVLA